MAFASDFWRIGNPYASRRAWPGPSSASSWCRSSCSWSTARSAARPHRRAGAARLPHPRHAPAPAAPGRPAARGRPAHLARRRHRRRAARAARHRRRGHLPAAVRRAVADRVRRRRGAPVRHPGRRSTPPRCCCPASSSSSSPGSGPTSPSRVSSPPASWSPSTATRPSSRCRASRRPSSSTTSGRGIAARRVVHILGVAPDHTGEAPSAGGLNGHGVDLAASIVDPRHGCRHRAGLSPPSSALVPEESADPPHRLGRTTPDDDRSDAAQVQWGDVRLRRPARRGGASPASSSPRPTRACSPVRCGELPTRWRPSDRRAIHAAVVSRQARRTPSTRSSTAWTASSRSAGGPCPAGSASGWPWRARCCATPGARAHRADQRGRRAHRGADRRAARRAPSGAHHGARHRQPPAARPGRHRRARRGRCGERERATPRAAAVATRPTATSSARWE